MILSATDISLIQKRYGWELASYLFLDEWSIKSCNLAVSSIVYTADCRRATIKHYPLQWRHSVKASHFRPLGCLFKGIIRLTTKTPSNPWCTVGTLYVDSTGGLPGGFPHKWPIMWKCPHGITSACCYSYAIPSFYFSLSLIRIDINLFPCKAHALAIMHTCFSEI